MVTRADPPAAQDGGPREEPPEYNALMFVDQFHPGARFRVVSGVIDWRPDFEGIPEQPLFHEYNTRLIRYLNTNEVVPFFPDQDADVERDQVYSLDAGLQVARRNTTLINVSFSPVQTDG